MITPGEPSQTQNNQNLQNQQGGFGVGQNQQKPIGQNQIQTNSYQNTQNQAGNQPDINNRASTTASFQASPKIQPSITPNTPPPKKSEPLKTEKIEVRSPGKTFTWVVLSASVAAIIMSLVVAYLQANRAAAAEQREAQYNEGVGATLESDSFATKEESVQTAGEQVSSLKTALAQKVYYTPFFNELESHTYKGTRFTRVVANSDGTASVEGVVSSFDDLEKTIAALKTSDYFNRVEEVSVEQLTDGGVSFMIAIEIDTSLLKPSTSESTTESTSSSETSSITSTTIASSASSTTESSETQDTGEATGG